MGFLEFLKPKSALEKAAKQVREPFAQPEYRQSAMDKLFELATPEAYAAALKRFTFNANGQIADESEKRELVDRLAERGDEVLDPLKAFIQAEKTIAFPIRALQKIVGRDQTLDFLIETLRRYEPLDHRSTQAKTTLIFSISELGGPESAEALVPYLEDHHDDVQFQTIEALEKLNGPKTSDALAKMCTSDGHAARVQRRAAQALLDLGANVRPHYAKMAEELRDEYALGKKGQLVKKSTEG